MWLIDYLTFLKYFQVYLFVLSINYLIMKLLKRVKRIIIFLNALVLISFTGFGQITQRVLEVMDTATIDRQLEYIKEKTNVYNGFRAVHEDIFKKLSKNALDTVIAEKEVITNLSDKLHDRSATIDSLNVSLNETKVMLGSATDTKNKLTFLGIEMDKGLYYSIVYTIIIVLIILLIMGYLIFKRNLSSIRSTKKDLEEIKNEFEEYRRTSRERHEVLVLNHFNEIKKLKEGRS